MIKKVNKKTFNNWLELCFTLWPDHKISDLKIELLEIFDSPTQTAFLFSNDVGAKIGFVNISLRDDYVPGATAKPTGYIEGIYVDPKYRNMGVAKKLIEHSKKWFLDRGCKEVCSDAEMDNKNSIEFHKAMGFVEKSKLVHFVKLLK